MCSFEELRENVLSNRHQKHDHERKQDSSYRNPRDPKAHEQVDGLEESESGNCLERHCFDEARVTVLEHSVGDQSSQLRLKSHRQERSIPMIINQYISLLVSSAWCSEQKENPFPELVPR